MQHNYYIAMRPIKSLICDAVVAVAVVVFYKFPIKESTQTEIVNDDVCELQEPGVGQKILRRSSRQVHRASKFKDLILSIKAERLFFLRFLLRLC